jgi:hypothetical protein
MEGTSHRTVAVFDFDGTLTTKDTLLLFIRYSCGTIRFMFGMALYSPLIVMMMLRLTRTGSVRKKSSLISSKACLTKNSRDLGKISGINIATLSYVLQ